MKQPITYPVKPLITWPRGAGMKVLELFAGSRSIGKAAERLGHRVLSLDIDPYPGIDLVRDILTFELHELEEPPDLIWASVPCTSYSMLAISHHRDKTVPKTDVARLGDQIVIHTLRLIREADCLWVIENPRAMLRKMPFMTGLDRRTVMYCRYGDTRMKPTDLWGNVFYSLLNVNGYQPRPICYNNNPHCHHERSPRFSTLKASGSTYTGGTTALKNAHERSKLPDLLCHELVAAAAFQWVQKSQSGHKP